MGRPNQPPLAQGVAEIRELWQWLAKQKLTHFRLFTNADFNLKGRHSVLTPSPCGIELAQRENKPDAVSFQPIAQSDKLFGNNIENLTPQEKQNIIENYLPYGGAWVAKKEHPEKEAYYAEVNRREFEKHKPKPTLESLSAEVEALKAALTEKAGKR